MKRTKLQILNSASTHEHSAPELKIFVSEPDETGRTYHDFYLFGEIAHSEEYSQLLNYIMSLDENDTFRIFVDCEGGDVFSTLAIIRAMRLTKAHTHVVVTGQCSSSVTMLFLQANTYEVEPHCVFMFHNYSGEREGKGGELYDNIVFERKWSEKLLKTVYEGFLSEAEILQILNNKDIWMGADEVLERMGRRARYLSAKKDSVLLEPSDLNPILCSSSDINKLELWVGNHYE